MIELQAVVPFELLLAVGIVLGVEESVALDVFVGLATELLTAAQLGPLVGAVT